jgi:Ca-activated chloride channel family protein
MLSGTDYGIRDPLALSLLVAVAIAIGAAWWGRIQSQKLISRLGLPALSPSRYPIILFGITLMLTAATLRPYWGSEEITVDSPGGEVVFLVDVSRSMFARDVPPSRMDLAKRKMRDIIDQFAQHGETPRYGITVFAGDAYTVCPITSDQAVVKQFIDIISPELVSSLGSNLTAGLTVALARLPKKPSQDARIILLSDGEDATMQGSSIVSEIRNRGIRIDSLGIGTISGTQIELPNGQVVTDQSRRPIVSKLLEEPLREVAQATGGVYLRATVDDSDILQITTPSVRLGTSQQSHEARIRQFREIGSWLVLAALALLVLATFIRGGRALILGIIVTVTVPMARADDSPASSLANGSSPFHLYERGEYEAAVASFTGALATKPDDLSLKQGLASSLYKLGRYKESEAIFAELSKSAHEGRAYFESTYNQGNALLGLKRYQDATDAYQKALDVKPGDPRATHNLGVARSLLAEERNKPTPTPTPTPPSPSPSAAPSQSPQESPSPSPSASPDTPNSGTPSPAASPSPGSSPSPNSTPSPSAEHQTPAGSPSPNQTSNPTPNGDGTQTPNASPSAAASPSPGATSTSKQAPSPGERLKEAIDTPPGEGSIAPEPSPQSQSTPDQGPTEADAWLESLPDSPLLIRRHKGPSQGNGQTW